MKLLALLFILHFRNAPVDLRPAELYPWFIDGIRWT